jgi:hypothetical protein
MGGEAKEEEDDSKKTGREARGVKEVVEVLRPCRFTRLLPTLVTILMD